jgi:hypothetical protein
MSDSPTYHPNPDVQRYLESLNEKEMAAYLIAKQHLGSSFNIEKCNGFLQWIKTNTQTSTNTTT